MSDDRFPMQTLDDLPDSWVDQLRFFRPRDVYALVKHLMGKRRPAVPPESFEMTASIPRYLLAEYHGLPNGYFSKRVTHGYISSFDRVMLGAMTILRQSFAEELADCNRVLDVGCGGGDQAATLVEAGIPEVVGIDASPYMVAHAHENYPHVNFSARAAENTGFADGEFDGVCISFVFHEIPPKYGEQAIAEIHRILKPGGKLIIAEPSSLQSTLSTRALFQRFGWRGPYFRFLARHTYEPFVIPWHAKNHTEWFSQNGFAVIEEDQSCPIHSWRLTRQ